MAVIPKRLLSSKRDPIYRGSFGGELWVGAGRPAASPRQRIFLASRIRQTWLRPTWMPASGGCLGESSQDPLCWPALLADGQLPGRIAGPAAARGPWRVRALDVSGPRRRRS